MIDALLDTVTFLWVANGSEELSPKARRVITDPSNNLYLSAASAWEILLKAELGKLTLPLPADEFIAEVRRVRGIEALPLTEEAVVHLPGLPAYHRDPIDRILVCQAREHGFYIVTPDPQIAKYPVEVIW